MHKTCSNSSAQPYKFMLSLLLERININDTKSSLEWKGMHILFILIPSHPLQGYNKHWQYLLWRVFNYAFPNFYIWRWLQKSGRVSLAWRGPKSVGGGGGCCCLNTFCLHIASQLLYVDLLFYVCVDPTPT